MGLRPKSYAQTGIGRPLGNDCPVAHGWPDVWWLPDFRWIRSVMGMPDVRSLRTSANFGSGAVAPDVWSCPVVRSLGGVANRPVLAGHPLAVACVGWDLAGWGFRCRTSGPDWSSGGCSFSGSSSSCPSHSVSSSSCPLDVDVPWLSSKYLITHSVSV